MVFPLRSKMNGFLPNSKFAIKAYLKYHSLIVLTLSFFISTLIFGWAVRQFERVTPPLIQTSIHKFDNFWNSLWCMVLTMTTIGYGDIYPSTHLGRLVTIIAGIWGVFVLSLFVVTLNNITQLTKKEHNSYEEIIRKDNIRKYLYEDAGKIIQTFYRIYKS